MFLRAIKVLEKDCAAANEGRRTEEKKRRGQEEAHRVAVMAFQCKLRSRELFGSASLEW